jgi:hypothetical protein
MLGSGGVYCMWRLREVQKQELGPEQSRQGMASQVSDMPQIGGQVGAWNEFRRLSRISWILSLSLLPATFLVAVVSIEVFSTVTPAVYVFAAWSVTVSVYGLRLLFWRCPRCSKPFMSQLWGFFTRHCPHCGLRKWEEL